VAWIILLRQIEIRTLAPAISRDTSLTVKEEKEKIVFALSNLLSILKSVLYFLGRQSTSKCAIYLEYAARRWTQHVSG